MDCILFPWHDVAMNDAEATGEVAERAVEHVWEADRFHPSELPGDEGNEPLDGAYPPETADEKPRAKRQINSTGPGHIARIERQRRALELRKMGLSYDAIAQQLGYASGSGAHGAVTRMLANTVSEAAGELREVQYARLNDMLARFLPLALGGERRIPDPANPGSFIVEKIPPDIKASAEVRALMQQINDLMGVAPDKLINHRVTGGVQHTVEGEITHQEGVIVVDFDTEGWQAALRRATQEGLTAGEADGSETSKFEVKPPTGAIAPALQELTMSDDDVIEAEIIEEDSPMADPRASFRISQEQETT